MALEHGHARQITTGYANGTFTHCTKYYCARCDFEVSEWQWEEQHKNHAAELHDPHGAALALPEYGKPQFITKRAGARG